MPAKNKIKTYQKNSFYHIYNRGVAKQSIFLNSQDYKVFLSYLKLYLSPPNTNELNKRLEQTKNWQEKDKINRLKNLKNFSKDVDLIAYCLMSNHFHLLIKQKPKLAIKEFMQSLGTKYSMYFNKKYNRVGSLFQGTYKAVMIKSDEQLLHLSRYIHLNPNPKGSNPFEYPYSSLSNYLGKINQIWIKPQEILKFFKQDHPGFSYKNFILEKENKANIQNFTLD